MKITSIETQKKNKDRVSISVDGKYRLSLDVFQLADIGLKNGNEVDEGYLSELEKESQFGKLYARALEYCLSRPHSAKEVRDYLYRKTRDTRTQTGVVRKGVSTAVTERVFKRLVDKGYINDENFTRHWVENRRLAKGASQRKLSAELRAKGVAPEIIENNLQESERSDKEEIRKTIAKKSRLYGSPEKLMSYLARQGYNYEDIKDALSEDSDYSA